jgi:hypothetical protein
MAAMGHDDGGLVARIKSNYIGTLLVPGLGSHPPILTVNLEEYLGGSPPKEGHQDKIIHQHPTLVLTLPS